MRSGEGRNVIREDGRTVDALAPAADEGRGHAAKRSGEALAAGDPEDSEWGNPPGVMSRAPGNRGGTRGTETSQYLRGKERIPRVAASERGGAQTGAANELVGAAVLGEERLHWRGRPTPRCVVCHVSRTPLERAAGEGESPVGDGVTSGVSADA